LNKFSMTISNQPTEFGDVPGNLWSTFSLDTSQLGAHSATFALHSWLPVAAGPATVFEPQPTVYVTLTDKVVA
jgi:hypothetical protein